MIHEHKIIANTAADRRFGLVDGLHAIARIGLSLWRLSREGLLPVTPSAAVLCFLATLSLSRWSYLAIRPRSSPPSISSPTSSSSPTPPPPPPPLPSTTAPIPPEPPSSDLTRLLCLCPGLQLLATRCSCSPPFPPPPLLSRAPAAHHTPGIVGCFRSQTPCQTAHSRSFSPFVVNTATASHLH
jgi:hypothetical protein